VDRFLEMKTFNAVVDAGSFVKAADALGMSKAAVSRYVLDMESRLGVRLLHRTTRRLSLTDEGQVFYARSKDLLAELQEAEDEITSPSAAASGLLRVNAPFTFGILHLAPLWGKFKAQNPQVTLDITLADRLVDLVGRLRHGHPHCHVGKLQPSQQAVDDHPFGAVRLTRVPRPARRAPAPQ
jgi:DNA-binding transcriptional LysR family regulator